MTFPRPTPRAARRVFVIVAATVAILVAACAPATTPAATQQPSPSAGPSAAASSSASGAAVTPEAAAALVLASDSRFTGIEPKNPDMIGACCFSEVTPAGDGFAVTIEIGWGDCPAGCINRHHWFYTVTRDGTVTFDHEDGPALPPGVPGTGGAGETGTGIDTGGGTDTGRGGDPGATGIRGSALAGPTCPVVSVDDPTCADRPIAGATVHVTDATGVEVAQLTTDEAGAFAISLPPGQYQVRGDAVVGLMGTPAPSDIAVDEASVATVLLTYDTGIR